jgi:hypothetical protein
MPISPEVKRSDHDAEYSPPLNDKIKNGGAIIPLTRTGSWHAWSLINYGEVQLFLYPFFYISIFLHGCRFKFQF